MMKKKMNHSREYTLGRADLVGVRGARDKSRHDGVVDHTVEATFEEKQKFDKSSALGKVNKNELFGTKANIVCPVRGRRRGTERATSRAVPGRGNNASKCIRLMKGKKKMK
jgi:hypothetical protein